MAEKLLRLFFLGASAGLSLPLLLGMLLLLLLLLAAPPALKAPAADDALLTGVSMMTPRSARIHVAASGRLSLRVACGEGCARSRGWALRAQPNRSLLRKTC